MDVFPAPVDAAAVQTLSETDWHGLHVGNLDMTAAVLAPGIYPITVGKPTKSMENNHCHVSSDHLNGRLLKGTAPQHVATITGVLQPCGTCLEAKGARAGVPRDTTSRAGKPAHRPGWPPRGVRGRVRLPDHARLQRL